MFLSRAPEGWKPGVGREDLGTGRLRIPECRRPEPHFLQEPLEKTSSPRELGCPGKQGRVGNNLCLSWERLRETPAFPSSTKWKQFKKTFGVLSEEPEGLWEETTLSSPGHVRSPWTWGCCVCGNGTPSRGCQARRLWGPWGASEDQWPSWGQSWERRWRKESRWPATPATGTPRTPTGHAYLPARAMRSPCHPATRPPELLLGCRERGGRTLMRLHQPSEGSWTLTEFQSRFS